MKGRLLVADDEEPVRQVVVKALEMSGYQCEEADGFHTAREKLSSGEFDILLTDKNMPLQGRGNEGGMELIRWVREHQPGLAVLVMTGYPTVDSAVEALKLGAFDYLLKPLDLSLLRQKVDRLWEYRRFVNPEAVFDMYLGLSRDILEAASGSATDFEARLSHVHERLDHVFQIFRAVERALLDHRQRLAEISSYAQSAQDQLPAGNPARKMLQHVAKEAAKRI